MIWRYSKISEDENSYTYSYSCVDENNTVGEIVYEKKTREIKVTKIADGGSEISAGWAADHFVRVIDDKFPDERIVRTG